MTYDLKIYFGRHKKQLNADLAIEDDLRYAFRGFIVGAKIYAGHLPYYY